MRQRILATKINSPSLGTKVMLDQIFGKNNFQQSSFLPS